MAFRAYSSRARGSMNKLDEQRLDEQRVDEQRLDEQGLDEQSLDGQRLDEQRLDEQRLVGIVPLAFGGKRVIIFNPDVFFLFFIVFTCLCLFFYRRKETVRKKERGFLVPLFMFLFFALPFFFYIETVPKNALYMWKRFGARCFIFFSTLLYTIS